MEQIALVIAQVRQVVLDRTMLPLYFLGVERERRRGREMNWGNRVNS